MKTGRMLVLTVVAAMGAAMALAGEVSPLEARIAAKHKVVISDSWGGGHRIVFDFNGRKGWVIEPAKAAPGSPWVWTMQWMGAFLNRTGAPALVARGWHHVHLEAFDTRADENGLRALAEFQRYLVEELGFARRANLIGMSWGGFYSVRYACAYPEAVKKIYLDAPLLCFDRFKLNIGPWLESRPPEGDWVSDPRMPLNMAEKLAATGIPVYLLYGGHDQTVDPKSNCEPFVERFRKAGGEITVEKRELYGHHPHGFEAEDIGRIIAYFTK